MTFEEKYANAMLAEAQAVQDRYRENYKSQKLGGGTKTSKPGAAKRIREEAEAKRKKIIALAEQGYSQKQIKAELQIGSATIKRHLVAWRKENA